MKVKVKRTFVVEMTEDEASIIRKVIYEAISGDPRTGPRKVFAELAQTLDDLGVEMNKDVVCEDSVFLEWKTGKDDDEDEDNEEGEV